MSDENTTPAALPSDFGALQAGSPETDSPEAPPSSFLVFPVSGYRLLLDPQNGLEYLDNETAYHVPNNHPMFRGLINRRGNLVPVYDIRGLLGTEPGPDAASRILVLGSGEDAVGIVLDGVPHRISITEEEKTPAPSELARAFGAHLGDCYVRNGDTFAFVALGDFLYELANGSVN